MAAEGDSSLQAQADSANASGLSSSSSPSNDTLPCGASAGEQSGGKKSKYELCNLSNLLLELNDGSKSASISLSAKRRQEPVASTTARRYERDLRTFDLLIEALADVDAETYTRSWWNSDDGATNTSPTVRPLNMRLQATDAVSHSTFGPAHPHTYMNGASLDLQKDAGAPVQGKAFALGPGGGSTAWMNYWPFGSSRTQNIRLGGVSCGVGGKEIDDLRMMVVLMPHEEWKITFGKGPKKSFSRDTTHNRAARGGSDGKSVATVVTIKQQSGSTESTFKDSEYADGNSKTTYQEKQVNTGVILKVTDAGEELAFKTWDDDPSKPAKTPKDPHSVGLADIKIQRKSGGQAQDIDIAAMVENAKALLNIVDLLKSLMDKVKIGWSISFGYSLFSGSLEFSWGYRWPTDYSEDKRVYYVERFFSVTGSCKLIEASIKGMGGIEFDAWWLGVSFVAEVYLTLTASVTVAATGTHSFQNTNTASAAEEIALKVTAPITPELGAKAGGRALGYSLDARLALESDLSFTGGGALSTRAPPTLSVELSTKGIRLVGEIIAVGSSRKTYAFKPVEIVGAHKASAVKIW